MTAHDRHITRAAEALFRPRPAAPATNSELSTPSSSLSDWFVFTPGGAEIDGLMARARQ